MLPQSKVYDAAKPYHIGKFPLRLFLELGYTIAYAVEEVGARLLHVVAETITMIVIGLILSVLGIGFFCWLLFTFAIFALPFFAGLTVGLAAFHGGAGVLGALAVGAVAGIATLIVAQIAFAATRSIIIRAAVALLFAVPAAIAGYHATLGLAEIGVPSHGWREAFAFIGGIIVGGMAWGRMTLFASPLRADRHAPAISAKSSLAAAVSDD